MRQQSSHTRVEELDVLGIQAGLSCQVRAVTRLPLTTTSRSTYVPPKDSMSSLHFATVVAVWPG